MSLTKTTLTTTMLFLLVFLLIIGDGSGSELEYLSFKSHKYGKIIYLQAEFTTTIQHSLDFTTLNVYVLHNSNYTIQSFFCYGNHRKLALQSAKENYNGRDETWKVYIESNSELITRLYHRIPIRCCALLLQSDTVNFDVVYPSHSTDRVLSKPNTDIEDIQTLFDEVINKITFVPTTIIFSIRIGVATLFLLPITIIICNLNRVYIHH